MFTTLKGRIAHLLIFSAASLLVAGCSDDSEQVAQVQMPVATIPAPATPKGINTVPGDSQAILTWARADDAESYTLYIAKEPGVTPQNYASLNSGMRQQHITSPHIIGNLENDISYYAVLTSVNTGGESAASTEITITPITSVPPPPQPSLTRVKAGDGQVELSWATTPGALQYYIYVTYPDDAPAGLASTTQQHMVQSTSYTVSELENGKIYYFALSAENEAGESPLSSVSSATPKRPIVRPTPPVNVSLTGNNDGSVTIDWDVKENIFQYDLFVASEPSLTSRNFSQLADGKAIRDVFPPYTMRDLEKKTYFFSVIARDENGASRDAKVYDIDLNQIFSDQEEAFVEVEPEVKAEDLLEPDDGNRPYEKLDSNGKPFAEQRKKYDAQPWACVRHKETGKMWEVKTADNSIRSSNLTLPWRHASNGACTQEVCDVEQYVEKVNEIGLCGYKDWRLPTKAELATLLDKTQRYPTPKTNVRFFPNTGNNYYWSGTTYKHDPKFAWFIYFASGYKYFDIKTNPMHVRVIRDGIAFDTP